MEASLKRAHTIVTVGLIVVSAVYAYTLIKIVLGKYGFAPGLRSWNLVPFGFVRDLLQGNVDISVSLKNILGNIAIFLPLSLLAPALTDRIDNVRKAAALGLCVSAAFECIQLAFGLGAADIDDLLLNTLGAFCGGALYFKVFTRCFRARARLFALVFLCLFGLCGVGALWLYAPNELPQVIITQNEEVLGTLDLEAYTLSTAVTGLSNGRILCNNTHAQTNEGVSPAIAQRDTYPLSDGAKLYINTMSYQFSPNGNIQKIFITYQAVDESKVEALLSENDSLFSDLWLDAQGRCTAMVLTVYED